MIYLFILLFSLGSNKDISSIYNFSANSVSGQTINFESFRGKKILIVNIATKSEDVNQLKALQQLQDQYENTLVVIAFPSNSFGNEKRSNTAIKQFCQFQYGVNFLIAAQGDVTGSEMHPVYQWLTKQSENGQLNTIVKSDFQKYIISETGELIGIFNGSVSPLSNEITSILNSSYN